MTHMPGIPVKFDPPDEWRPAPTIRCLRSCGAIGRVRVRTHNSSCGGFEDDEFECQGCGFAWWVDGIDS